MAGHDENRPGDPELDGESARDLEVLGEHSARWWGEVREGFHEGASEVVPIDLHVVPARVGQPYHVVLTTGMSHRPITLDNAKSYYCELLLALPPDWPMGQDALKDERFWWPFRQLKEAARFPHLSNTPIWYGHTVWNSNPPRPFHETVPYCGGILSIPVLCPKGAWSVQVREGKEVFFFAFVPLFEAELRFAEENGSDALFERLDQIALTELIQTDRTCAL